MSFQFLYWWVIPVILVLGAGIITASLLYKKSLTKRKSDENTVLVANSVYARQTPAYQQALKRFWLELLVLGVTFTLVGIAAGLGAGRAVDVTIERPEKHNRDIVLCLDASGSMFDVDKEILEKFTEMTESFKGERIGLTVWNASASQVFPLTDDYEYIQEQLSTLAQFFGDGVETEEEYNELSNLMNSTLGREEGASLVGDGLYGCSLSFDNLGDTERSRSIILATDNVVNGAELVPFDEAAEATTEKNIRVYGINPGSRTSALGGAVPPSAISEMQTVVESTGGEFFELNNTTATSTIIDSISQTEASLIDGNPMIMKTDVPLPLLYTIFGLIVLAYGFIIARKY